MPTNAQADEESGDDAPAATRAAQTTTDLPVDVIVDWCAGLGVALDPDANAVLIAGGRSNLTYRLSDRAGHTYILRRPPLRPLLPRAHDMAREARIMSALAPTAVPVPTVLGGDDGAVLGAPFYLMTWIDGAVAATHADGRLLTEPARRHVSEQLADVLAAIHRLDVDAVGLGDLGRRDAWVPRQLDRWHRQFHAATAREVPLVDELHRRLTARTPPQRHTGLVHGDYRPGNVLLGHRGDLRAVLDWELCSLGDPFADLGWMLATWSELDEPQLYPSPTAHIGFLTRREMMARYELAVGRQVPDIDFYLAFSLWRLACIHEGIYTRYRTGAMGADGGEAAAHGELVLRLLDAAHAAL